MNVRFDGPTGVSYRGTIWRYPRPDGAPLEVGLTPKPAEAPHWFAKMLPAVPAFCRIFSAPGHGLPAWTGNAISQLPEGCLPWISHKDPVPMETLRTYWKGMPLRSDGRRYRWTYFHETAPGSTEDRSAWRNYWLEMNDIAEDFPWIEPVQIQSNYAMRWRPDTDWADWLIAGVSLGFDCYPLQGYRYEPPQSMFGLLEAAAEYCGAPSWGVPELGAEPREGQDRASWLYECEAYLAQNGASFCGLWCAQDTETGLDYRPTDEATLAAYQEMLG